MKASRRLTGALILGLVLPYHRGFCQDDDFSLNADTSLNSEGGDKLKIDDDVHKSDLFDDEPVNPLAENAKSTIVKSKISTEQAHPSKPQSASSPQPGGVLPAKKTIMQQPELKKPLTPQTTGVKPTPQQTQAPVLPLQQPAKPAPTANSNVVGSPSLPQNQPKQTTAPQTTPLLSPPNPVAKSAAPAAPLSNMSSPSLTPASITNNQNSIGPKDQGIQAIDAPLKGDGTMAPVKNNQVITPNDFGGVPPLPGTRKQLAPGEAPEIYAVEEGDTMFDVCSQLIDDGNYWPKLWSLNPDVKNPHFIYPGMQLAFYSGDSQTPPYLEVVTDDEILPIEKGSLSEKELVSDQIPLEGKSGGSEVSVVASEVEPPIQVVGPNEIGADSDGLDGFIFAGSRYSSSTREFMIPAFFFAEEKESLGEIKGGAHGERLCGDGQLVFIEPIESLGLGTFTILRPAGKVRSAASGEFVGFRYDVSGHVKITRQTKSGLFEAKVFGARSGVRTGDIVVNFVSTRRSISETSSIGSISAAQSSVIGFEDAGKTTGGQGDIVFLEKTGLSAGVSYGIYRKEINRDIRHIRDNNVAQDGTLAAVVKIIEINGESAIGELISGRSDVRIGDTLSL